MTDDRGYLSDIGECIDRIEAYTSAGRDATMHHTHKDLRYKGSLL